ncbi:hypothetical protein MAUB1S_10123 [Mycolicibacterium aubagnense]
MANPSEIELKLKWRKTWDNVEDDFVAVGVPGVHGDIGRIYKHAGGPQNARWSWSVYARLPTLMLSDGGTEDTAREAAKKVEDLWFEYGQPEADKIDPTTLSARQVNLYALAKGRA